MGKVTVTDDALRQAAASVRRAMLGAVPPPEACRRTFSAGFEEKMEQLFRSEERRSRRRTAARRVAAVFLCAVIGLGAWLAVDAQARASFVNWIREAYETYVVYRFTGEVPADKLPEYRLGWLPDGYAEASVSDSGNLMNVLYVDENQVGRDIVFVAYYVQKGTVQYMLEVSGETVTEVNGAHGYFHWAAGQDEANSLFWLDETGETVFILLAELPREVMLRMAESLCLENAAK